MNPIDSEGSESVPMPTVGERVRKWEREKEARKEGQSTAHSLYSSDHAVEVRYFGTQRVVTRKG